MPGPKHTGMNLPHALFWFSLLFLVEDGGVGWRRNREERVDADLHVLVRKARGWMMRTWAAQAAPQKQGPAKQMGQQLSASKSVCEVLRRMAGDRP